MLVPRALIVPMELVESPTSPVTVPLAANTSVPSVVPVTAPVIDLVSANVAEPEAVMSTVVA